MFWTKCEGQVTQNPLSALVSGYSPCTGNERTYCRWEEEDEEGTRRKGQKMKNNLNPPLPKDIHLLLS